MLFCHRFPVLLLFLLVLGRSAWACSCAGDWPSPKARWNEAPVVFLGTVVSAVPDLDSREAMSHPQKVQVRVEEGFKGVRTGEVVELTQGTTSCDAKFRAGKKAVFYLDRGRTPGSLAIPWCTRGLGDASPLGDDLLFLRGLPKSASGTRLSGVVDQTWPKLMGAGGVRVTIVGRAGGGRAGRTVTAVTNAAGVFEVYDLEPDWYRIRIDPPRGWKLSRGDGDDANANAGEIEKRVAPDAEANSASALFLLYPDTRVEGRLLDHKGAGLKERCLRLLPVAVEAAENVYASGCTKDDGRFEIREMPPGQYKLKLEEERRGADGTNTTSAMYFPGVRDPRLATVLTVEAPSRRDAVLRFQLPAPPAAPATLRQLSGRVVYADGVPVPGATVTFTGSGGEERQASTRAGPDGAFVLSAPDGMTGRLQARMMVLPSVMAACPQVARVAKRQGIVATLESVPQVPAEMAVASDRDGIQLEMPVAWCEAGPKDSRRRLPPPQ